MARKKLSVCGWVGLILAALNLWSLYGCKRYYVAFGDSIAKGYGDCPKECEGYPPKLAELLNESSIYTYVIAKEGGLGRTSSEGADYVQTAIDNNPNATQFFILLGTKDSTGEINHITYGENIQQIIDSV